MKQINWAEIFVRAFLMHVSMEVLGGACGIVFLHWANGASEAHIMPGAFSIGISVIHVVISHFRKHKEEKSP